ncbi:MAG TPA: amidohydrolase family protein [Hyphomicrobiales bacterium]|nr:amidohydrolase family protein [Hyphomicrobiales bacterium]
MGTCIVRGVTIVDTRDGTLTPGMAVAVAGGRIAKIAPADAVEEGGSAQVIDAHGKFAVPGYLDMHGHPLDSTDPQGALALMLASGITGFRQMSGSPDLLRSRREGTLPVPAAAPELLAMPGMILLPLNAGSPADAVAEVRRQKEMGADFIKVISVRPDAFFAALEEATRLGLPVAGHLTPNIDAAEASRAGMRAIEHLGPQDTILIGCSTDEAALRAAIAQAPPFVPPIAGGPRAADMNEDVIANPVMVVPAAGFSRMRRVIDTFSEDKCREVAATFAANGTWQVPTLIRIRTMNFGDDPAYRADPNLRYVPGARRQMWDYLAQRFAAHIAPPVRQTLAELFALQLRVLKLLAEGGVRMAAGSDSGSNGQWDIAGFALHQEFDLLEQAGLSPLRILQMATLDAAALVGREASLGRVAEGKNADLVLLDGDPTASAQNLHAIWGVVRGGTYHARDDLAAMKEGVAAAVAA